MTNNPWRWAIAEIRKLALQLLDLRPQNEKAVVYHALDRGLDSSVQVAPLPFEVDE